MAAEGFELFLCLPDCHPHLLPQLQQAVQGGDRDEVFKVVMTVQVVWKKQADGETATGDLFNQPDQI